MLRDGLDAIADVLAHLTHRSERGQVTISATIAFTAGWFVPRVANFQLAHPDIDLRLNASDEIVNLPSGEADLAIGCETEPYPGLDAELLFADRFAPSPTRCWASPARLIWRACRLRVRGRRSILATRRGRVGSQQQVSLSSQNRHGCASSTRATHPDRCGSAGRRAGQPAAGRRRAFRRRAGAVVRPTTAGIRQSSAQDGGWASGPARSLLRPTGCCRKREKAQP